MHCSAAGGYEADMKVWEVSCIRSLPDDTFVSLAVETDGCPTGALIAKEGGTIR
jgi:hypothetical protein